MITVVVLGGYGNFGAVISARLSSHSNIDVIVAGRNRQKAETFAASIGARGVELDTSNARFAAALKAIAAEVIVHCAGPFQNADYAVARAAIDAGISYIDIADGRRFVCDIVSLDGLAKSAGVAVVSGASSVPALSSAVVDAYRCRFKVLNAIRTGITASEKVPGEATIAAVLSYAGRPIDVTRDSRQQQVFGWQGLHKACFSAPVSNRWLCHCDVPDLELFPARYAGVEDVSFSAGVELTVSHFGTWLLAGLRRSGLLKRPERFAGSLRSAALRLERFGSGASGMFVRMSGIDERGQPVNWRWELIARNNDGVNVPCLAAVALCRKVANGASFPAGARPCVGLLTLEEYLQELQGLAITVSARPEAASSPTANAENS